MLPFEHTWLPFIYLYGLGGILFVIGVIITLKAKSLDLQRAKHKRWLLILIFGFIWYFSIHLLLNLAALDVIRPIVIPIGLAVIIGVFGLIMTALNTKWRKKV